MEKESRRKGKMAAGYNHQTKGRKQVQWTEEQERAIQARGCSVLVSAAAGSGKTSVLVARILEYLQRIDLDRLLVVTFTNAAAAQMREQIARNIKQHLEEAPLSRRLQRQLALLDYACISTLHSFCMEVLRQHFYLLSLDPQFRVMDEDEAALLEIEVLEEFLEKKYGEPDNDGFLRLVDCYGGERDDQGLARIILQLYRFSRSHPWPQYWLRKAAEALEVPAGGTLDSLSWSAELKENIRAEAEFSLAELKQAEELCRLPGGPVHYLEVIQEELSVLEACSRRFFSGDSRGAGGIASWEEVERALRALAFGRLPGRAPKGVEIDKALKERVQKLRSQAKKRVEQLQKKYFSLTAAEHEAELGEAAGLMRALVELVIEFGERFDQAKRERGVLDFSDLEHCCLRILCDAKASPPELIPSAVAREFQERFVEVLVDEYQDINAVQEAILYLVSRESREQGKEYNLFMVGDVKQSIYRFRLADPTLFLQKYHTFLPQKNSCQRRIDLSFNFRSSSAIVAAVNFIFRQIMTPGVGEIAYDRAAELVCGRKENSLLPQLQEAQAGSMPSDDNSGDKNNSGDNNACPFPVEVWLVDLEENQKPCGETEYGLEELENGKLEMAASEETGTAEEEDDGGEELSGEDLEEVVWLETAEAEACLIAQKIKELLSEGWQLSSGSDGELRPLSYRDIVVLMRTTRNVANIFVEEFNKHGIPVCAELTTGYFKVPEVETIISLLQVIDNPRQDIPLVAVLYSPLAGLSAADLARIRLQHQGSFYDAAAKAKEDFGDEKVKARLRMFFSRLEKWRTLARRESISVLLREIYRDTGYYDFAGGLPAGPQRQANLRLLENWAGKYEAAGFKGLSQFLQFVERLLESGGDRGAARTLSENEDVVRIMSIHRSKGLEFPVVFVAGLGRKFNLEDIKRPLLMHKELGLGPQIQREDGVSYPTLAKLALKERIKREMLAEEMRLLYVAMTRARERLFLVGACRSLNSRILSWAKAAEMADFSGIEADPSVPISDAGSESPRMFSKIAPLPDFWLSRAECFLDWIGAALCRHSRAEVLRERAGLHKLGAVDEAEEKEALTVKLAEARSAKPALFSRSEENSLWEKIIRGEFLDGCEEEGEEKRRRRAELRREIDRCLSWTYPYSDIAGLPAKLTVTEAKRLFALDDEETAEETTAEKRGLIQIAPAFGGKKGRDAGPEKGIAMHILMQHLDFSRFLENADNEGIESVVSGLADELLKKGLFSPAHRELIDIEAVSDFVNSPLGKRIIRAQKAGVLWREVPFTLVLPAEEIYAAPFFSSEQILLQGVIDCLAKESNGFLILDYKTDYLPCDAESCARRLKELEERYRWQLKLYARAVEIILNAPVKDCYLYFLSARKAVRIEYV